MNLKRVAMSEDLTYRIRPAGRHLLTIGRDLIQDNYAAVVELVKNAYDADSPNVEISFVAKENQSGYTIKIKDYGHGMSRDVVIGKWMVPSTNDKLERKQSPKGRVMQGRKGIGRYAASVLGTNLLLETVSMEGEKTVVYVEWDDFENSEYLDQVDVLVESYSSNEASGTTLVIDGNIKHYEEWSKKQFDKLRFELKKLVSPTENVIDGAPQGFKIELKILGFSEILDVEEVIAPYPIFDLFDYKISGIIYSDGKGVMNYELQKVRNAVKENIVIDLKKSTGCGNLFFDIRVYDRETESITTLIKRGLKDESGNYLGKLQARQILNDSNGIGVYRNGFRIRPLGDSDFDWLKLNEQRVQNPSLRIGSNQVIGYVTIQSEEQSNLIEKSARDGLRENFAYEQLREITKYVIGKLEERRFSYRRKAGLSKPALKVEKELERIFSLDKLKTEIRRKLTSGGMKNDVADEVIDLISREEEEKAKTVEEIRRVVATYQGQATLGKIISVVLHEGRRPLNYFRNEVPRISRFREKFEKTGDYKNIEEIINISTKVESNSIAFSNLFGRLDPLASGKRSARQLLFLKKEIENCFEIFRQEMEDKEITFEIHGDDDLTISAWKQDILAIFTNLIDNSIYWIREESAIKKILVNIESDKESLIFIDFIDTGLGIEPSIIEDGRIFEPEYSTKSEGTGIGLAIAGEAAERNGLKLTALESETGAYFRLQIKENNNV